MIRRNLLRAVSAIACLPAFAARTFGQDRRGAVAPGAARARPGDARWPSDAEWQRLGRTVGGRLVRVRSPLDPDGLSIVHHGVGSERWSADGFTRLPER